MVGGRKMFAVRQEIKRTAKRLFAVRFFLAHGKELACRAFFLCRTPYKKTHGKQSLCRAPEIKHTAKNLTHGKCMLSRSEPFYKKNKVQMAFVNTFTRKCC
jgi:hypothetical protein